MKNLKNLGKVLGKKEQKTVNGGGFKIVPSCQYGDSICCGTATWQCGTGTYGGGFFGGYFDGHPICNCV